jgi:eukaryotic-like serine/threonine-protein kinase
MVLQVGDTLQNGKYTIEHELGRGRFAITYLANRTDGKRQVIKILNPQVLKELAALKPPEHSRLKEQFLKEAQILAKCNTSPHIVKVSTLFQEGDVVYLPMEYIDGNSLSRRSLKIMPEELALKYIRQIGEALALVHANELTHCDIRPDNIFLRSRQDGLQDAVLADFGLALDFDTKLTRTRERERADGFSAPELYTKDRPIGACSDIYSLAATLYDLVTGVSPIGTKERSGRKLESPRSKNNEVSSATSRAILSGMEINPEDRPNSVEDWLDLLPVAKSTVPTDTSPKSKPRNWQTIWMGVSAIATIIGFIVAFVVGIPALSTWHEQRQNPIPKPTATPISGDRSTNATK